MAAIHGDAPDTESERELKYNAALLVPLVYLQAATLPSVDWERVTIIGANFRLAPRWLRWHEHIERDPTTPLDAYMPCNYTVAALLTVDNPDPLDSVLFYIPAAAPATEEEEMADAVVRVLAGDRKVGKLEALAAWFRSVALMQHVPDAPEVILRDRKPLQIPIALKGEYFACAITTLADLEHYE